MNLASRLESLTKEFHTRIIVSETTVAAASALADGRIGYTEALGLAGLILFLLIHGRGGLRCGDCCMVVGSARAGSLLAVFLPPCPRVASGPRRRGAA